MAGKSKTVAYAGVRLVADIGDFKKKMKSASKRVADFSKKTAKFALGAGVGITALSATVVAGVVATTRSIAESTNATSDFAKNLGLTIEEMQAFARSAQELGVESDTTRDAIMEVSNMVGDLASGATSAIDKFELLGLTLEDFDGLSTAEQFQIVMDGLGGIEDQSKQTFAAMEFFGDDARQILGLAKNVGVFNTEFERLKNSSAIITQSQADALKEFSVSMDNAQARFGVLSNVMASEFAPTITRVFNLMSEAFDIVINDQEVMDGLFGDIKTSIDGISLDDIKGGLKDITTVLKEAVNLSINLANVFKLVGQYGQLQSSLYKDILTTFKSIQVAGEELNIQIYSKLGLDEMEADSRARLGVLSKELKELEKEGAYEQFKKIEETLDKLLLGADAGDDVKKAFDKVIDKLEEKAKDIEQVEIAETVLSEVSAEEAKDSVETITKQTAKENKVAFAGTAEALNSNYLTQSNEIAKRQLRELQKISKRKPKQANYTMVSI